MNVALFLPNWLGDLVMATPTLRALRQHYGPAARLVGIVRPHLTGLLAGTPWLDELWPFHAKSSDPAQRRWALVKRMRAERFDLAILLTNSLHTAALAWLGGARRRLGYRRSGRGWLLTDRLEPRRDGRQFAVGPMVDYYLALAAAAGCPPESPRLELALTPAEQTAGDAAWQRLGLGRQPVIVLNSSGAYGAAKLWPAEHFAGLARKLATQLDHDVLVLCGPQERDIARQIVRQADHPRVVSVADEPIGLGLSKACVARCRLMVSTDSGPRHLAGAFGKPVVTLFGPTSPLWVANPTIRGRDLQIALDCIPCAQRSCPLKHHRCMQELSVARVFAAVAELLAPAEAHAA